MTDGSALKTFGNERCEPASALHEGGHGHSRLLISLERPRRNRPIVHGERSWRLPDVPNSTDQRNSMLVVSRWQGTDQNEHSFEISSEYHILAIVLRPSRLSLRLGARLIPHQEVVPGMIQVTPPGLVARAVYSQPYDILHLHIPNVLLMECFAWSHGKWPRDGVALRDPLLARDALLQKLGTTLVSIADIEDQNGSLLADFLGLAIVTHLLGLYGESSPSTTRRTSALPKWRLKRAVEFIDAHLHSSLALADLAGAAGLSCMHFAAQFRAATGVRPHEYLVRRRVAKAQTLLATTDMPIAELALTVGFSSQAHFTVVFKRLSGLPPLRWRQVHCLR
ncbi:helix-turn-helix transcriptional regulator [Bradyrhizobium cenepequi]